MSVHGDEIADFDFDADLNEKQPLGYQSPLMARMQGSGKLTLDLLRRDVPIFHAGEEAAKRLNEGSYDGADEHETLTRAVLDGEAAKERLVLAGIPLIKHLAKKEFTRRQNWQSQVTYDDLVQEGSGGFIRGLRAYKVHGGQKSATNYLGQWVLTDMRRNVEAIDNDFGVAYDAAERFRKIRAIRSRLSSSLGREPTDEEVLEAAADPMFRGGQKIGRVNKETTTPKRQLTQAQLDEERELRSRVGHTARFAFSNDTDEYTGPSPDQGRSLHEEYIAPTGDPEDVIEDGARVGLTRLLLDTFNIMGLPMTQREIVSRRYGLPPHEKEHSARDISRDLNLHREKVGRVVEAFTEEMSRPGGAFHRACGQWEPEDLADLGLGWTLTVLGHWSDVPAAAKNVALPEALTAALTTRKGTVPPPPDQPAGQRGSQVRAQFVCDYHGWGFVGVYLNRNDVPKVRACPQCGRDSALVRVTST
jgi:DNA-directed RNA polymerase sigma subunit (sigma70/sigma32)